MENGRVLMKEDKTEDCVIAWERVQRGVARTLLAYRIPPEERA